MNEKVGERQETNMMGNEKADLVENVYEELEPTAPPVGDIPETLYVNENELHDIQEPTSEVYQSTPTPNAGSQVSRQEVRCGICGKVCRRDYIAFHFDKKHKGKKITFSNKNTPSMMRFINPPTSGQSKSKTNRVDEKFFKFTNNGLNICALNSAMQTMLFDIGKTLNLTDEIEKVKGGSAEGNENVRWKFLTLIQHIMEKKEIPQNLSDLQQFLFVNDDQENSFFAADQQSTADVIMSTIQRWFEKTLDSSLNTFSSATKRVLRQEQELTCCEVPLR